MGIVTLYAALFTENVRIDQLELYKLPEHYRVGGYLLNVNRILDLPQVLTLAAEKMTVDVTFAKSNIAYFDDARHRWKFSSHVLRMLKKEEQFSLLD